MPDIPPISHLSPPVVAGPITECSEAVYVSGFVPQAIVRVYGTISGVDEELAQVSTTFGYTDVTLSRPVKFGESISATQQVDTLVSFRSIQPVVVVVTNSPAIKSSMPVVTPILYECGLLVPVDQLIPGGRLHVSRDVKEIANVPVARTWRAPFTPPLKKDDSITAIEWVCEGSDHGVHGNTSKAVVVQAAPFPVPSPKPEAAFMIPGNNIVTLSGLLVGASIEIFDNGLSVGKGWATGDWNSFYVKPALTSQSQIAAAQKLCEPSLRSAGVSPSGQLLPPILLHPICPKSRFVVIRGSTISATVVVQTGGSTVVAYSGAAPGDLVVGLGDGVELKGGDVVTAIQIMGQTVSMPSNAVIVADIPQPAIEILGGEPFFLPKANEQPIIGPVFPRGRGNGPVFQVQACCSKGVHVEVLDPFQGVLEELDLTEVYPGYFTGTWPWTSTDPSWDAPNHIPVGMYTVKASSACNDLYSEMPFFVIFNPADVGGPPRFSFDDTAVWFSPAGPSDAASARHYALHQSDSRIFFNDIQAITGHRDPIDAAIRIFDVEQSMFGYSELNQTQDTLDLLANHAKVGSADDASFLTAMLRAVGIPAYPVSSFDWTHSIVTSETWVEFLADRDGKRDWWVVHPNRYPTMQPVSRRTFGTMFPTATKESNDLIVMANEKWVSSQLDDFSLCLTYKRNSCNEPEQNFFKANFVEELCEKGYWPISHWDCSGALKRALRSEGFSIDAGTELTFGGRIKGSIMVANGLQEPTSGTVIVEVIVSARESSRIAEEHVETTSKQLTLNRGESSMLTFELKLPATLAPGHDLFLWAHVDSLTVALHPLIITPGITCKISEPNDKPIVYVLGAHSMISATVTNTSDQQTLKGVHVELKVPFSLAVADESKCRLDVLEPGKSRDLVWKVKAVAPMRSGSFKVSVATANAGSIRVHCHFQVSAPPAIFEVLPGMAVHEWSNSQPARGV